MTDLLNERIIYRKEVLRVYGKSATSLWRDIREGLFPPPVKVGKRKLGWKASDIKSWLDNLEYAY